MPDERKLTSRMRVHSIVSGRLLGNVAFWRGGGPAALLRRRKDFEWPVLSFVVEHPEGLLAIDAGLAAGVHVPRLQRRFAPVPTDGPHDVGASLRDRGLDVADVRWLVITHLDWDHAGGLATFPNAEILVHRPEREFADTFPGRQRYQPKLWPPEFDPVVYDLDPEPYGPFDRSRALTDAGDVRLVPLPGHSPGQVGVAVETEGPTFLFSADHVLRQDWFLEDWAGGRLVGLGQFGRRAAIDTTRRLHRFVEERPTVLVPSHDEDAPRRIEDRDVLTP